MFRIGLLNAEECAIICLRTVQDWVFLKDVTWELLWIEEGEGRILITADHENLTDEDHTRRVERDS